MEKRLQLQSELEKICDNVYFQPPESIKLKYPCIVYHLQYVVGKDADDMLYNYHKGYSVTYIDKNPDNTILEDMFQRFKYCRFERYFTVDNLNHYLFVLYYR